jgi:hypothetical protein
MKAHMGSFASWIYVNKEEMKAVGCLSRWNGGKSRRKRGHSWIQVTKEKATVETIGVLEDWYGGRDLAVGCHREVKKWTQGGPRVMVCPSRSWPLSKDGWPALQFLHHARDTVMWDQSRMFYVELLKDRLLRRDVGRGLNTAMAWGTKAWDGSCIWGAGDILWGPWTNHQTGGCETSSQVFLF